MGSIITLTQVLLCAGGLATLALLVVLTIEFTHQRGPFKPANEPPHARADERAPGKGNEGGKTG